MTKSKQDPIQEAIAQVSEMAMPPLIQKAKKLLMKHSVTLLELAEHLDCSPKTARAVFAELKATHHNVDLKLGELSLSTEIKKEPKLVVNSEDFLVGEWQTLGVLGDTHLANVNARLDVLNCLYDIYEREGITKVFHTGNAVDGECRFNRHELLTRAGFEPQMEYFANEYPQRNGITTMFITGEDHEGWWTSREGINVGKRMQQAAEDKGRKDLVWIGHVERDVEFKAKSGRAWLRVMHPGGGSSYAVSYTEQKIVEALQGGEKPHIQFIGHYHKFNQGYPREVHTVQTGCTCDQTAFLRRMKIRVDVGGTIVRFHQATTGEINRFNVEWIPFYDRGFYSRTDKYRRW